MDPSIASVDRMMAWRDKPMAFVEDLWPGFVPERWQEEFWIACCRKDKHKRIALQACVGVGKTTAMAIESWRRLAAYGRSPNHWPRGLAVAIDRDNLKGNFWAEMAKWRVAAPILEDMFQQTSERISRKGRFHEQWYLDARGWSKKANAEEQGRALSGLHSEFPFVIADESATIPQAVLQTAKQIESSCEDSLIVQSGNPTSQEGALYHAATREKDRTTVIAITSDPDAPNRCNRMSKEWAQEQIDSHDGGRDNPWVQAMVLGQFPKGGINQLLTYEEVDDAMKRSYREEDFRDSPCIISVDTAGGGMDPNVITARQGIMTWQQRVISGDVTGMTLAGMVAHEYNERKGDAIFVDDTGGYGRALIEALRLLEFKPIGVQYAGRPMDPGFKNKRAEMWWNAAQGVKNEGWSLPSEKMLREDLVTPLYFEDKQGKLQIEDKDAIKARLQGRSTDRGDSFVQTTAFPVDPTRARNDPNRPLFWAEKMRGNSSSMCEFDDPRKWED